VTSRGNPAHIFLLILLLVMALLAGRAAGKGDSAAMLVPVGTALLLLTLFSPALSLLAFLVFFLRLGGSPEIDLTEWAILTYMALLFLISLARFLWRHQWDRQVVVLATMMFILMGFLALTLGVALANEREFSDWGRDVFPLAVLCIAVIFTTCLLRPREWQAAALGLLVVLIYFGLVSVAELGGRIGLSLGVPQLARWMSNLVPPILISLGIALTIEYGRLQWLSSGLVLLGVLGAVLTPTRTQWLAVGLNVAVLAAIVLLRRRRPGTALAVVVIAGGLALSTVLYWRYSGPTGSWQQQTARFSTLRALPEDPSVKIRKEQVLEALRLFASAPLLGVGLGYQYRYQIPFTGKYERPTNYNHSDLANYLAKMGLLGTALLYTVLVLSVLACVRLQKVGPRPEDRAMGLTAEAVLIVALFAGNSTPMLQERSNTFFLALVIGLVMARLNLIQAERAEQEAAVTEEQVLAGEYGWAPTGEQ